MDEYRRAMTRADIEKELGISQYAATEFLWTFGVKIGRPYVIEQREFRHLQLNGTIAKWLSAYAKRKVKQDKLFRSKEVL